MLGAAHVFTLGHSPDPDDAFMFYAMAEHKIDLFGYRFEHRLEDIQTLNERALRGELDISAISIHAYAYVADKYALLPCGASMGDGYGPIVIRKRSTGNEDVDLRKQLRNLVIAVPGKMTSAYLALQLYLGNFKHIVVPFDRIFDAVSEGHERKAGEQVHRHVRERFHSRLRRNWARCDPQVSGRRAPRRLHRQSGRDRIRPVSKEDYFFGFSALPTCFRTNVFTRLNSF